MINNIKIENAKFVISKEELAYKEVIEDFKKASRIHILTYNISKYKSDLLKELKECSEDTEICIISNIPGRWEKYYGDKRKASKNIALYKRKLSLEKISKKTKVYFCFSNHAKIIMTNNIAYIGSSNFSEESANNFESGFISKDTELIDFLEDEIFPWIIDNSRKYKTDEEILFFELAMRESINMFKEMQEEYLQIFYYNTTDSTIIVKAMEKTEKQCNQYIDLLKNANKVFSRQEFFKEKIDNLDDVIEKVENIIENIKNLFRGDIGKLARYDRQNIINEYINEHYIDENEESLESCIDKAMDVTNDAIAILANIAKEEVDNLLEKIKNLEEVSKKVLDLFEKLPLEKIKIDNT